MDVILITGFLGAGKTSLIRHLLSSGFDKANRIAVIVNEAGRTGIDGEVISKETGNAVNLMELTSGCICCTLKSDFLDALLEIHKSVNPTHLIVEATGIAQPGEIFEILHQEPITEFSHLKNVITVVDADFFEAREALGSFYNNQIKCADIILLNKIDTISEAGIEQIKRAVFDLNPDSIIIPSRYCAVDPDILIETSAGRYEGSSSGHFIHFPEQGGFRSFTFESPETLDKEKLDKFMESLPPDIFRCKGWVRFKDSSALLQYTGGRFNYKVIEEDHDTVLVFIGRNFHEERVRANLEKCIT